MDPLSKSHEEVRKTDEAQFEQERRFFAEISAIIGSPGFHEFVKIIEADRDRFRDIAESEFDSVLNPTPLKALACAQYAQSILDKIKKWKEAAGK